MAWRAATIGSRCFPKTAGRRRQAPAFTWPSRRRASAAVDAFHAAALRLGGRDEGAPGARPHYSPTYYAAFVTDPDGHKLEAVHQ